MVPDDGGKDSDYDSCVTLNVAVEIKYKINDDKNITFDSQITSENILKLNRIKRKKEIG